MFLNGFSDFARPIGASGAAPARESTVDKPHSFIHAGLFPRVVALPLGLSRFVPAALQNGTKCGRLRYPADRKTASRGVVGNQRRDSWWRQVMAMVPMSGAGSLSRGR